MAVNGLAADIRSLESIRTSAKDDPRAAVQAAAKQFEALFMQELLKSMRATTQGESLMGGGASEELATGMLDQQYATSLTGMPGGLAEALTRQLERSMGLTPGPIPVTIDRRANPMPAPIGAAAELLDDGFPVLVQQLGDVIDIDVTALVEDNGERIG